MRQTLLDCMLIPSVVMPCCCAQAVSEHLPRPLARWLVIAAGGRLIHLQ